jgi:hypothetical protein
MKKISKKGKIGFLIIVAIFAISYLEAINFRFGAYFRFSSKIIHPDENGFNPDAFHINDYNDYNELLFVISRILPKGTEKKIVKVFFEKQNISAVIFESINNKTQYIELYITFPHIYWDSCFWDRGTQDDRFVFTFNKNATLEKVMFVNGCCREDINGSCYRQTYHY